MAEAIAERVRRYILDGGDEDLRRLLGMAETTREMARSAFRRVGMQEGWHAIDCGCGPIGGLAVMAEMVGPAGRVVGVAFSEPAIRSGVWLCAWCQSQPVADPLLHLGERRFSQGSGVHLIQPGRRGVPYRLREAVHRPVRWPHSRMFA
jgi:hypothetical protein